MEEGLAFAWVVIVDLVFPLEERLFLDDLQVVHLVEKMSEQVFRKAFGAGVHLHCVNRLHLFPSVVAKVFLQ